MAARGDDPRCDGLLTFSGGWGLVEGSLDEWLRWEGGGSRPADEATLQPGTIEVGKTGPDEGRAGWLVMYVGGNAAARQGMPDRGPGAA